MPRTRRSDKKPGRMSTATVKHLVRERDSNRCTKCGAWDLVHVAQYGRRLEVHRLVPGSVYTVEGCVLLCKPCHSGEPKREKGTPDHASEDGGGCFVRLPRCYKDALKRLKAKTRRETTVDIQIAVNDYLSFHELPTCPIRSRDCEFDYCRPDERRQCDVRTGDYFI